MDDVIVFIASEPNIQLNGYNVCFSFNKLSFLIVSAMFLFACL